MAGLDFEVVGVTPGLAVVAGLDFEVVGVTPGLAVVGALDGVVPFVVFGRGMVVAVDAFLTTLGAFLAAVVWADATFLTAFGDVSTLAVSLPLASRLNVATPVLGFGVGLGAL